MAFFDRPKISPAPFNKIKIQEFGDDNERNANKHGISGAEQYAKNKAAVICFLSDYNADSYVSNRLVTFMGFIEDLQIKNSIEYEDQKLHSIPVVSKYLKGFNLGYSLTFNVVAHSVNEAMSNAARFSELERILIYPYGSSNQNEGAENKTIKIPNSYVFMSNLINNGLLALNNKYSNITISNAFVRKHGLRTAVQNIKFEPDLDLGVFEFNNRSYFKAYKIILELPITNDQFHESFKSETEYSNRFKMLLPYSGLQGAEKPYVFYDYEDNDSGTANVSDSKGFPFCVPWSANKILTSYARGVRAYGQNKRTKIGICINNGQITRTNNPFITKCYCVFDAFVDSFSYERSQDAVARQRGTDVSSNSFSVGAAGVIAFNMSINIPSYSVIDAEANCMKLNSLFRMIPIMATDDQNSGVRILFNNFIKNPKKFGSNGNYDFGDIYDNGLECFITSLNLSVDLDSGFFEYNDYFLPKAMKLDMQIAFTDNTVGSMIYETLGENPKRKLYNANDSVRWPFGVKYSDAT